MDGRRLNVLYVSRGYTTHDRRFLGSFARAGWSPTHLPMMDERLDSRPLPDGVKQMSWGNNKWPDSAEDMASRVEHLRGVLREMRPDVVIAGPIQHGSLIAAQAGAVPLVSVSWGTDLLVDADASLESQKATREALGASALVFGDCRAVREAVKAHGGPDDDHIVTFPWGIDLDRYHAGPSSLGIRADLGWQDAAVFISTRTWEPVYAIDVLLDAFAALHQERDSVRLVLLGDGSLAPQIRAQIDELGIRDLVHAPGRVPQSDLPEWFRMADAYVSSALSDGTSISLLEAMATGLPVVVSESFGNLEWVEQGVNGALAKPGSADSLSKAMRLVIEDPSKSAGMSSTNIETAMAKANWDNNFPALVKAVEQLVNK
ncbi:MAG TPA: glycosyltransferase family 4 protein [Gemmatimonadaceae bacterium]|nr:glycosyltransferase family 4 protein [Gemmatimonadaceae bacterium]